MLSETQGLFAATLSSLWMHRSEKGRLGALEDCQSGYPGLNIPHV